MTETFEDIKIVDLDEDASGPYGKGAYTRVVLRLSKNTPQRWADLFNQAWCEHYYQMKREASVSGDDLEVICVQEELAQGLLDELKEVTTKTNNDYRSYLEAQHRRKQTEDEQAQREREKLSNLKGQLKFD